MNLGFRLIMQLPIIRFPLKAKGYSREFVKNENEWRELYCAIGYYLSNSGLLNTVTLYYYSGSNSLDSQFLIEKQRCVFAHEGHRLISENKVSFTKNGKVFDARAACFQYRSCWNGGPLRVLHSELILISLGNLHFKIRSTAPLEQAPAAQSKLRELLEKINWAF